MTVAVREEKSAYEKKPEHRTLAENLLIDGARLCLHRDQMSRLRHAVSLQAGTKRDRRRSRQIAEEVERDLRKALNETIHLELARGGEVVEPKAGPIRMKSRDGLHTLYESGALTEDEYEAGRVYRAGYEAMGAGLGSQLADRIGGYAGPDAAVLARLKLAKAGMLRSQIDRRVALDCIDDPNCLSVLRSVAGQGFCIRSLVQGGEARARQTAALKRALGVAANTLRQGR